MQLNRLGGCRRGCELADHPHATFMRPKDATQVARCWWSCSITKRNFGVVVGLRNVGGDLLWAKMARVQ
jgi:hypothetical protein